MRLLLTILITLSLSNSRVHGQRTRLLSKLYIYNSYNDYQLEIAPNNLLKIGSRRKVGYAYIETDLDSLGFKDPTGQTVYLIVEPGKYYYYGYEYQTTAYKEMSANAFWLSVATFSKYHRHYSITRKAGVVEIE